MKIKLLTVENLKGVKYLKIEPQENMIVIAGNNGAGKTSALDAISWALTGGDSMRNSKKPIRAGEEEATVLIELDDIIVKRVWNENNSYLTCVTKEGVKYNSPQRLLDSFIGKLSFDPLEFAGLKQKEQRDLLLDILGLKNEIIKIEEQKKWLYDTRTLIGREVTSIKAQFEALEHPKEEMLTAAEIKMTDLSNEFKAAIENNNEIVALAGNIGICDRTIEEKETLIRSLKAEIVNLKGKRDSFVAEIHTKTKIDIEPIEQKMKEAEGFNNEIREAKKWLEFQDSVYEKSKEYEIKTRGLQELDNQKTELIKASKMPVSGMGFDDFGVTYGDLPFEQLSSAEKLKISMALAMVMNPKLRVIRITDGSLLDENNMRGIEEMAKLNDFQIWIERVSVDSFTDIIMVEGEGKSQNEAGAIKNDDLTVKADPVTGEVIQ